MYEHQFFPGTIFGRDFAAINLGDLVDTGCGVFNTFQEGDNGEVSLRMENPLILSMKTESLSTTTTRFIISAEDFTTKSLLSIQLSILDGARIISAKSNNSNVSKNGYSINDDGRSLSLIQLPDLSANESVLASQDIVSFIVEHPSSVSDLKGIVQLSEISGEDNVYYDYTNKSVTATRGLTLSTKAVATENGLNILASPNPFNGELQISSNLVIQSIRVISMEGKLLSTFNQLNQNSVSLSEMFKGDLPAGNYLIEVTSTNGNRETIKVAKK